jgi:TonB family protein
MKLFVLLLALCLTSVGGPVAADARATGDAACATSAAKIVDTPRITVPEGAKVAGKRVAFEVDIGSDGRVRGLQMDQSSGDASIDLSLRQSLQAAAYQPPQTGCVAYSGGLYLGYSLSADAPATLPEPSRLVSTCTPYIQAFLTPNARDRRHTGTAIVAVELDAAATPTAAPALRKSSGSPDLDREAVRIAANGHYRFLFGSSCTPQAFTYLLEMTFE